MNLKQKNILKRRNNMETLCASYKEYIEENLDTIRIDDIDLEELLTELVSEGNSHSEAFSYISGIFGKYL